MSDPVYTLNTSGCVTVLKEMFYYAIELITLKS